ncbi:esterase-like activity of phytase family protein [Motilimonas sp. 1_MG-2023]|uniref:esterase-like activity of phytase family protein n=1 Tax=Motilimonas sp. 1_MG-2023 TaxID=3062672 RepID=UPI0026E398AC|nr:esterase-like activity of phytase family protein [Motilimonas sp. 1_MG-2023]MDO6527401.1 esterase-like activity of phytase family protein [Motilimonas sp. 1_MG-2023]
MIVKKGLPTLAMALLFNTGLTCAEALNVSHVDSQNGAPLPYQVLRNDITDHAKPEHMLEIRNGGFGSDMTAHPTNKNQFYALTDRGPNATYKQGEHGKGKIFPTPDYTPRIGLFEVNATGKVTLVRTILLKQPDGTPITGLPNRSGLGGTGETPYDTKGQPITVNADKPFDAKTNPLKLDDFGLDGEGLVALKDGTFWVSDEYGPHIVHFDSDGVELSRINPFAKDKRTTLNLPAEFANRRPNRGMEGLAITPDESTLVGIMQSTMHNPDKKVKDLNLVRLVTVNLKTGEIGQYLYQQEKAQNANSGIVALSANEFLVIERDGAFLRDDPNAMKHIYRINLAKATNLEAIKSGDTLVQDEKLGLTIAGKTLEQVAMAQGWDALASHQITPVSKSLVADLVKEVKYPHDKLEGMWLINPTTLGVLNDDDFATWSSDGKLEQKYLDKDNKVIDASTLYIIDLK